MPDYPGVEILASGTTHGHATAVLVPVPLLAGDGPGADTFSKGTRGPFPEGPAAAISDAALPALGSIDSVKADTRSPDVQGVAVEYSCAPG